MNDLIPIESEYLDYLLQKLNYSLFTNNNLEIDEILAIIAKNKSNKLFEGVHYPSIQIVCYDAAKKGNLKLISLFFECSLNKDNALTNMMMIMAAEYCHLDIIKFLLKHDSPNKVISPKECEIYFLILSAAAGRPIFKRDYNNLYQPTLMSTNEKSIRMEIVKEFMNCNIEHMMADFYQLQGLIIHACEQAFLEFVKYFIDEVKEHPHCPTEARNYQYMYSYLYLHATIHNRYDVAEYLFEKRMEQNKDIHKIFIEFIAIATSQDILISLNHFKMTYLISAKKSPNKFLFQTKIIIYCLDSIDFFRRYAILEYVLSEAKRLGMNISNNIYNNIIYAISSNDIKLFEIHVLYNITYIDINSHFINKFLHPQNNFWRCIGLDFQSTRMDLIGNFDTGLFKKLKMYFMKELIEIVFERGHFITKATDTHTGLYKIIIGYCQNNLLLEDDWV